MTGRPPLPLEQRKRREHGTNARYRLGEVGDDWRNGCRCHLCTDAAVTYEKQLARRKANGWEPYVDAAEAVSHLEFLRDNGVGLRAVAEASGVPRSTLRLLLNGERRRVRPETLSAVLGVHLGHAKPGAVVDGRRTMELVDELLALGHTKGAIAQALGCSRKALQVCRRGTLRLSTAQKVAALHEEWTRERDARRQWEAERQADYRRRRDLGELNYTRSAS